MPLDRVAGIDTKDTMDHKKPDMVIAATKTSKAPYSHIFTLYKDATYFMELAYEARLFARHPCLETFALLNLLSKLFNSKVN